MAMSMHTCDDFIFEKHHLSGMVYITTDSRPELCFNFSKEIKVRVTFSEGKNKFPKATDVCIKSAALTTVNLKCANSADVGSKELISTGLSGRQDILTDLDETDVDGELLKTLFTEHPENMVAVNVNGEERTREIENSGKSKVNSDHLKSHAEDGTSFSDHDYKVNVEDPKLRKTSQKSSSCRNSEVERAVFSPVKLTKTNESNDERSIRYGSPDKFSCKFCLKTFKSKDVFDSHVMANPGSHKCNYCLKTFPYAGFLLAHNSMYHMNPQIENVSQTQNTQCCCHLCGHHSKDMFQLIQHMCIHSQEYYYKCCICEEKLKWHNDSYHMVKQHGMDATVSEGKSKQHGMDATVSERKSKQHGMDATVSERKSKQPTELTKKHILHDQQIENSWICCDLLLSHEKGLTCKICKNDFLSEEEYIKHLYASGGNYKCEICSQKFPYEAYLLAHVRMEHAIKDEVNQIGSANENKVSCHLCGFNGIGKFSLKKHMFVHTGDLCHCCVCGEAMSGDKCLSTHAACHKSYDCNNVWTEAAQELPCARDISESGKGESEKENGVDMLETDCEMKSEALSCDSVVKPWNSKMIKCIFCEKSFSRRSLYNEHFMTETGKYKCTECDTVLPTKVDLHAHTSISHSPQEKSKLSCHICLFHTASRSALRSHMITHTDERIFKCCVCGEHLRRKKAHMKKHVKQRCGDRSNISCSICAEIFPNKTDRNMHYKIAHPHKILHCPKPPCPAIFLAKEELDQHVKSHATRKKAQCSVCGKFFSSLKLHLLTHNSSVDEKDMFHCDQCPKKFTRHSSLSYHKSTHNKEKSVKCPLCSKIFPTSISYRYREHLKTHLPSEPYTCEVCGKEIKERWKYMAHVKRHANSKASINICQVCNRKFSSKRMLSAHLKAIHSVDLDNFETPVVQSDDVQEIILISEIENDNVPLEEGHVIPTADEAQQTADVKEAFSVFEVLCINSVSDEEILQASDIKEVIQVFVKE